jgi:hypothetical protein
MLLPFQPNTFFWVTLPEEVSNVNEEEKNYQGNALSSTRVISEPSDRVWTWNWTRLIHWGELQIPPVGKNAEDQNHSPDDDLSYLRCPGHKRTVHPLMLQDLQRGAPRRQEARGEFNAASCFLDSLDGSRFFCVVTSNSWPSHVCEVQIVHRSWRSVWGSFSTIPEGLSVGLSVDWTMCTSTFGISRMRVGS